MQSGLLVPSQGGNVRVFRRLPDGLLRDKSTTTCFWLQLTCSIHFGEDQDFPPGQPVARIDDQVAYRPSLVVDEEILDVTDLAIRGLNMVAAYGMSATQIRVIVLFSRFA